MFGDFFMAFVANHLRREGRTNHLLSDLVPTAGVVAPTTEVA